MSENQTAKDALERIRIRTGVEHDSKVKAHGREMTATEVQTIAIQVAAAEIIENLHAVGGALFGEFAKLVQLAAIARKQAEDDGDKKRLFIPRA